MLRLIFVTVSCVLLQAASLFARELEFGQFGPNIGSDYQLRLDGLMEPGGLSLPELQEWMNPGRSYEEFLDYLAARRPELYERVVLVHDSGSIQFASLQRPRVILFADGLIFAFAEDPSKSERRVEILGLNTKTLRFETAELRFQEPGASYTSNPSLCQSCHGTPLKPLWEPYDFWPNAYGSSIGRLGSQAEKDQYTRLRNDPQKSGIYRRLILPPPPPNNNRGMPGIEAFTQYVTQLQLIAHLQTWKEQEARTAPFLPAVLAVLNRCTIGANSSASAKLLEQYLPDTWQGVMQRQLPDLEQLTKVERDQFKAYQESRYQLLFPQSPRIFKMDHQRLADESLPAAQMRLLLREMGIDVRRMTLSQGANPYLLSVPSDGDADLATNLALIAPGLFEELQPNIMTVNDYGLSWARFDCQKLKEKSRSLLREIRPLASSLAPTKAPTVMGECMRCHVLERDRSGAPLIPFDRTSALATYLQTGGGAALEKIRQRLELEGPGRMPPNKSLSPKEREDLLANLRRLMGNFSSDE